MKTSLSVSVGRFLVQKSPNQYFETTYAKFSFQKCVIFDENRPKSALIHRETCPDILPRGVKNCVEYDYDNISRDSVEKFPERIKKSKIFTKNWKFLDEGAELESWFELWKCF